MAGLARIASVAGQRIVSDSAPRCLGRLVCCLHAWSVTSSATKSFQAQVARFGVPRRRSAFGGRHEPLRSRSFESRDTVTPRRPSGKLCFCRKRFQSRIPARDPRGRLESFQLLRYQANPNASLAPCVPVFRAGGAARCLLRVGVIIQFPPPYPAGSQLIWLPAGPNDLTTSAAFFDLPGKDLPGSRVARSGVPRRRPTLSARSGGVFRMGRRPQRPQGAIGGPRWQRSASSVRGT